MGSPGAQLVQFAFAAGIDESVREEVMPHDAGFRVLENGRWDAKGAYNKRFGFSAQTLNRLDATTRSAGQRLIADGTRISVIDGAQLDTYNAAAAVNSGQDRIPGCATREIGVPQHALTGQPTDVAYANGMFCIVANAGIFSTGAVYATIVDETTGAVVRGPDLLTATGGRTVVTSFSNRYFVAFVAYASTTSITAYILDANSAASINTGWSTLATVTSALSGSRVAACSLTDRVAVVFPTASGTDRANVKTYNASGLLESATINTSSTTPSFVAVAGSIADTLWVAWNESTACKLIGLDADNLASTLATTATVITAASGVDTASGAIGLCPTTSGAGRYWVSDSSATVQSQIRGWTTSAGAVSPSGSQTTVFNVLLSGRPFYEGGRCYVNVMAGADQSVLFVNVQANCILVDWTDDVAYLRPIASIESGLVPVQSDDSQVVTGATSGKRYFVVGVSRATLTASQRVLSNTLVELDFTSRSRWLAAEHNGSTYIGSGLTAYFDGSRVQEAGFLIRPATPAPVAGGTGITLTNGRKYVAIYEDVDANGNWIVSGISDPSATTGPQTNKTITVSTSSLTVSYRASGPSLRVAFYATLDANNNLPPYYRLGATTNSTASATVSFADVTSEATLSASSKLYSPNLPSAVGASLDRRAPPGLLHLVSFNGFLVGSRGRDLWYSGQSVRGEATWFSPVFQVPVDGGGDITGLAVLDGSVVVFKRREVHLISGEPPADNGTAGGLGIPRRLAVDVGCIEPNSIVVTALGIFFQSERGIELLTRAQSVEWVGESVQDTVAAFPVCAAATLNPYDSVVYFEMASGESGGLVTGTGRALVYDLTLRAWVSTDRRKNQAGTADTPAQSAAMVWTGSAWRYAWLGTEGRVYVEDRTTHLDPGSAWVTLRAETGWVKLGGIQGMQHMNRVLWLSKKNTRADLKMYLAYDYNATYQTAATWVANDLDTLSTALGRLQVQHAAHDDAEGQAIRIKFEDATPTGGTVSTGKGATWVAVTLEGTPRAGAVQVSSEAA